MDVSFLRGTQAQLDAKENYTEGAFYVTEDTQRLYFAKNSQTIIPLNPDTYTTFSDISITQDSHNPNAYNISLIGKLNTSNTIVTLASGTLVLPEIDTAIRWDEF